MDCRVKPGNDDGWVRAALKSRTPLRESGTDGRGATRQIAAAKGLELTRDLSGKSWSGR